MPGKVLAMIDLRRVQPPGNRTVLARQGATTTRRAIAQGRVPAVLQTEDPDSRAVSEASAAHGGLSGLDFYALNVPARSTQSRLPNW